MTLASAESPISPPVDPAAGKTEPILPPIDESAPVEDLLSPASLSGMVKFELNDVFFTRLGGVHALGKQLGVPDLAMGLDETADLAVFERNREKYGINYLPPDPLPSYLRLLWEGMQDATMIILMLAGLVSFIIGLGFAPPEEQTVAWIEGLAIFLAVLIVLNIQAGTDYGKARTFRKQQLAMENQESVFVFRNKGACFAVNPKLLVVGDVLKVQTGDVLSVDAVLIDGTAKLDYSALTGESKLIEKNPDEYPFLMSGTSVMDGRGRALVVAVGPNSVQGQILVEVNRQKRNEDDKPGGGDAETGQGGQEGDVAPVRPSCGARTCGFFRRGGRGCCSFWRAFFTFGRIDAGGMLVDKLDRVAIDVGKIGLIVSFTVFIVLIMRWSITEFGQDVSCNPNNCTSPCENVTTGTCQRYWVGGPDGLIIVGFFITAVTILVVAVPEGLPLAVTLSLRVAMMRMSRDQNNVKTLDSVETMGSATCICSDKTGTLTTNRMTAVRVGLLSSSASKVELIAKSDTESLGEVFAGKKLEHAEVLLESLYLCTDATSSVSLQPDGKFASLGNATECALLRLCVEAHVDYAAMRTATYGNQALGLEWGVFSTPFSSSRKQMSYVVKLPNSTSFRVFIKGAPSVIFEQCSTMQFGAVQVPVDRTVFELEVERMQDSAMRTLATAYRDVASFSPEDVYESDFCLVCVLGIEDPLRPNVIDAMAECRTAGVDVRMCTGDALSTAVAIALQCSILRHDVDMVDAPGGKRQAKEGFAMTGAELDERVHELDVTQPKVVRRYFNLETRQESSQQLAFPFLLRNERKVVKQKEFDKLWPKLRVLARCLPEDKLTLVRGMRKSKVFFQRDLVQELHDEFKIDIFPDYQVVAVTGDGTNDAMALKEADVGFAMGIAGTKICKRAADIIIMDDNFASIVPAVKWGRNVFDSISKFIQFQLTVNLVAITVASIGAFVFEASPLRAVQMLYINLIMDSMASVALAAERPKPELLSRAPYGKRRPIISPVMYYFIGMHACFQLSVLFAILWAPTTWIPGNPPAFPPPGKTGAGHEASVQWTVLYNSFVMMTLGNEFNARSLPTPDRLVSTWQEWNVFRGITGNPTFIIIFIVTLIFQVIIVEFAGPVFIVVPLSADQWGFCIGWGFSVFAWQFVVNACIVLHYHVWPVKLLGSNAIDFEAEQHEHEDEPGGSKVGGRVSLLETSKEFDPVVGTLVDRPDAEFIPWNKDRLLNDEKQLRNLSKRSVLLDDALILEVGKKTVPAHRSQDNVPNVEVLEEAKL